MNRFLKTIMVVGMLLIQPLVQAAEKLNQAILDCGKENFIEPKKASDYMFFDDIGFVSCMKSRGYPNLSKEDADSYISAYIDWRNKQVEKELQAKRDKNKQRSSIAGSCGKEVIVRVDDPRQQIGMADLSGYELLNEKPVSIKRRGGTLFTTSMPGTPNAGEVRWGDADSPAITDISKELATAKKEFNSYNEWIASCSYGCCDTAREYCALNRDNHQKIVNWLQCVSDSQNNSNIKSASSTTQEETPQIPNCPRVLPKSCAIWSIRDSDLHTWNVKNNCRKDISVTFAGDSGQEDTKVFGSGEIYQASLRSNQEPDYIVWDAQDGIKFYRKHSVGALLKCKASIQF